MNVTGQPGSTIAAAPAQTTQSAHSALAPTESPAKGANVPPEVSFISKSPINFFWRTCSIPTPRKHEIWFFFLITCSIPTSRKHEIWFFFWRTCSIPTSRKHEIWFFFWRTCSILSSPGHCGCLHAGLEAVTITVPEFLRHTSSMGSQALPLPLIQPSFVV